MLSDVELIIKRKKKERIKNAKIREKERCRMENCYDGGGGGGGGDGGGSGVVSGKNWLFKGGQGSASVFPSGPVVGVRISNNRDQ